MKRISLILMLLTLCVNLFAQSVTLTFTGRDVKNQYVKLHRVAITNLTQNWQETIYYPDTILIMGGTGINDFENSKEFRLSQNVPNPFEGVTDFELQTIENGNVILEMMDMNGRVVVGANNYSPLPAGTHHFRVTLSTAGTYLLTARCGNNTATIKMVNNSSAGENAITYLGEGKFYPLTATLKGGKGQTDRPFTVGDKMKYVGYAFINDMEYTQTFEQNQTMSEDFVFSFEGAPYTLPTVMTTEVSDITMNSAVCGGYVIEDGGIDVTVRGVCWGTSPEPTGNEGRTADSSGIGEFTSRITGLTENTIYYVRAYAINRVGTAYGEEKSFKTKPCEKTVTDYDNNTYNTMVIGNQCWMKENLRTTKYADGTPIEQDNSTSTTVGYWYYPNNNESNKETYGLLYNWQAVMGNASPSNSNPSGVQGICPTGWHVPSDDEWQDMINTVEYQIQTGEIARTTVAQALASIEGWKKSSVRSSPGYEPSTNNASGFGALPAGRHGSGFGEETFFCSTTVSGGGNSVLYRGLSYTSIIVTRNNFTKDFFFSVRCLRD